MPTYDNPIGWGNGFKFGQAVPVDDRMIFNDTVDADSYLAATQFNVYEGLWAYFVDPGDYYMCQRQDINIPQDNTTNPYVWKRFSGTIGGLPALGYRDQQLVMDADGVASIYDYANQRGLTKFVNAVTSNPFLTEGMLVLNTAPGVFTDYHDNFNYPLNNASSLPLYCVFKILGNDVWMGRQGIIQIINHGIQEREPLFLRTQYLNTGTYHQNILTTTKTTTNGELLVPSGHAIDANNLFIDLTQYYTTVGGGISTGNATIQRDLIQKAGSGGIVEDPDGYFTIPHGFGDQRGTVQIVALNVSPAPDGATPNMQVSADQILFGVNEVRIKLDYGTVDPSLVFEVVMLF